jgi:hypothetical protein
MGAPKEEPEQEPVEESKPKMRPATSVRVELPPSAKPETAQKGGSVHTTRVSGVSMTGFETIIDSVFSFDSEAVYQEVLNSLEFQGKASRAEYGMLIDALDAAEEVARKALQLVANAKVACVRYLADVDSIRGQLREDARNELLNERDGGKAPTIADIEARVASAYHDEHRDIEVRIAKAKRSVEYLEGLASLTAERARDLRQMVAKSRGA